MDGWIYVVTLHVDEKGEASVLLQADHPHYQTVPWDHTTYQTCDFTRTQRRVVEELWIAVSNLMERYTYEL